MTKFFLLRFLKNFFPLQFLLESQEFITWDYKRIPLQHKTEVRALKMLLHQVYHYSYVWSGRAISRKLIVIGQVLPCVFFCILYMLHTQLCLFFYKTSVDAASTINHTYKNIMEKILSNFSIGMDRRNTLSKSSICFHSSSTEISVLPLCP